ncbi:MAG TPA: Maf family protein [Candidatus Sulfotelmatobacter sp.]|nr:Maf family protein [Candidatus Sulfotelmatobacter sp.]
MLILASASPRRKELLRNAGISFTVQPADLDETPLPGEAAQACAERLAREKALAVWRTWPQSMVLGADTVVVVDDVILNKPADADDAGRMLRLISGRQHEVITGVCLVSAIKDQQPPSDGRRPYTIQRSEKAEVRIGSEVTRVTVNELSDEDIRDYVASGEPMDKAGAYAIQGLASRWIPRIEGDYSNVVGLPVALVYRMLRERWDQV